MRVVRDDERGLVAWLPAASEVLVPVPVDGKGLREPTLAERVVLEYEMHVRTWRGPGILRVAPTGKPWSLWYFWNDDGGFEGHYVNLELVHQRPVSGDPRVHTRDLTLDLWIEGADVWLKDEDELEAAVEGGRLSAEQGDVIRAIGEQAAHELGHHRSLAARRGLGVLPTAGGVGRAARPPRPAVRPGGARPGVRVEAG